MLPPGPGEGIQIHFGPKDYNDPAEIATYVIVPGEEFNNSVLAHIPLDEERWWNRDRGADAARFAPLDLAGRAGKPAEGFYQRSGLRRSERLRPASVAVRI